MFRGKQTLISVRARGIDELTITLLKNLTVLNAKKLQKRVKELNFVYKKFLHGALGPENFRSWAIIIVYPGF